ncbi:2OG-Fe(II) oxygenase [Marinicaulis aureus]|uniref:2OG-Fe(II) oxygenase n=1 Tax=Hyphococcus aureus TaxID=2666033 RepID=A0ABW1L0B2_9PROT
MSYLPSNPQDRTLFEFDAVKDLGKELNETYVSGDPFPHIAIDDFLPEDLVKMCIEQFPTRPDPGSESFNRDQERYKTSYHPDNMAPALRHLFYAFNSRPFIRVVENITGIKGLLPDPFFLGGGFHETRQGGHLDMHADFNHHKPLNLERRVNVLIYLNPDWKEEYGGQLELWRTDMSEQVQCIVPIANRCVMFTTTGQSMHGHPQPVNHPGGGARRSIALYYYTSTWDETKASKTTQFYARPGTHDRYDWHVRSDEILQDFLPPVLMRQVARVRRKLARH